MVNAGEARRGSWPGVWAAWLVACVIVAACQDTAPGAPADAHSYYEAKYKDPNGIVFDLTHTGWVGAVKDVVAKT